MDNPKRYYEDDSDAGDELTVGRLKAMLELLPDDYLVSFDSALGHVVVGDFTVYHKDKKISING